MGDTKTQIQLAITATDKNNKSFTRDSGSPLWDGQVADLTSYKKILAAIGADEVVPLPAAVIQFLYIKNTMAAGNITVKATPNGGAEATLAVLPPNGVLMMMAPTAGAGIGYTSVKVNPSAVNMTMDLFIGA